LLPIQTGKAGYAVIEPVTNGKVKPGAARCKKQLREHLQEGRGDDDTRRDGGGWVGLRNWAGVCRIIGLKRDGSRPIVGLKGFSNANWLDSGRCRYGDCEGGADTVRSRRRRGIPNRPPRHRSRVSAPGLLPSPCAPPCPSLAFNSPSGKAEAEAKASGGRFSSGTARPNF
jgi:hypothetical protein